MSVLDDRMAEIAAQRKAPAAATVSDETRARGNFIGWALIVLGLVGAAFTGGWSLVLVGAGALTFGATKVTAQAEENMQAAAGDKVAITKAGGIGCVKAVLLLVAGFVLLIAIVVAVHP